jgi:hypothetical protein
MAGKSAQAPELIDTWTERLEAVTRRRAEAQSALDAADKEFRTTINDAFGAGLSVTPIKNVTKLTISRLYQIKAGRRT